MLLAPLAAVILPFLLWPVELVLPYPYFVEEIAKTALILLILKDIESNIQGIKVALILGALFAISESVLYIFNMLAVGTLGIFLLRFAVTIPLHSFTIAIIFIFAWSKKVVPTIFGLTIAMVLHYLFNFLIPFLRV